MPKKYTKEWLESLCAESYSYAEVLRKAGRAQGGGSQKTLRNKISEFGIDISHFTGQRWQHSPTFQEKYSPENLFIKSNYENNVSLTTLRKYLLRYELIPYICSECGCTGEWMGKILSLELHHKDGDTTNNQLDNLTFLCPNCHAVTENFGGKKNKGQERIL